MLFFKDNRKQFAFFAFSCPKEIEKKVQLILNIFFVLNRFIFRKIKSMNHQKDYVSYKFAIGTFIIPSKYEEQCKVVPKFKYAKFDMHDKVKEKKEM